MDEPSSQDTDDVDIVGMSHELEELSLKAEPGEKASYVDLILTLTRLEINNAFNSYVPHLLPPAPLAHILIGLKAPAVQTEA